MTTKKIFEDRTFFKLQTNPDDELVFFDHYYAENIHYGCLDTFSNVIVPKTQYLKSTGNSGRFGHQIFDVVLDMFARVKINIRMKAAMQAIETDNADIIDLNIRRAYEDPNVGYDAYFNEIIRDYHKQIKNNTFGFTQNLQTGALDDINSITSFEQYVKYFFYFLQLNYQNTPITFGKWLLSNNSSIFSTGLAISIADIDINDDAGRAEFLSTNCFSYFKKICLNEGFYLLENTPWVMLANISSPAFYRNLNRPLVSRTELLVDNVLYYNKIYNIEYNYIKNLLIESYNNFATENTIVYSYKIYGRKKTIPEIKVRQLYPTNDRYTDDFWIDFFIECKSLEENYLYKNSLEEIKDYRKKIQKILDKDTSLSYINSIFREQYKKPPFAYRHLLKRYLQGEREEEIAEGITRDVSSGGGAGGY